MVYTYRMKGFYESDRDWKRRKIDVFETNGVQLHFHAQIEILCVTKDCITVTVNGETERLCAGSISVSGSYDVHSYLVEGDGAGTVLIFPIEYLQRYFAYIKDRVVTRHFICDKNVYSAITDLINLYKKQTVFNRLFDEGWVNTVMGVLSNVLEYAPAHSGGRVDAMREVLTYIRDHYEEDLSLKEISRKFGYSPYHFSRLFNSFANVSLKQYVNSVRLEAALNKLKNGESITDAAFNSGFGSMRSFYRDFNENYGETPQKYVRSCVGEDIKLRDKQ